MPAKPPKITLASLRAEAKAAYARGKGNKALKGWSRMKKDQLKQILGHGKDDGTPVRFQHKKLAQRVSKLASGAEQKLGGREAVLKAIKKAVDKARTLARKKGREPSHRELQIAAVTALRHQAGLLKAKSSITTNQSRNQKIVEHLKSIDKEPPLVSPERKSVMDAAKNLHLKKNWTLKDLKLAYQTAQSAVALGDYSESIPLIDRANKEIKKKLGDKGKAVQAEFYDEKGKLKKLSSQTPKSKKQLKDSSITSTKSKTALQEKSQTKIFRDFYGQKILVSKDKDGSILIQHKDGTRSRMGKNHALKVAAHVKNIVENKSKSQASVDEHQDEKNDSKMLQTKIYPGTTTSIPHVVYKDTWNPGLRGATLGMRTAHKIFEHFLPKEKPSNPSDSAQKKTA